MCSHEVCTRLILHIFMNVFFYVQVVVLFKRARPVILEPEWTIFMRMLYYPSLKTKNVQFLCKLFPLNCKVRINFCSCLKLDALCILSYRVNHIKLSYGFPESSWIERSIFFHTFLKVNDFAGNLSKGLPASYMKYSSLIFSWST